MRLDASGKVSLDHIYTAPDPRTYFQALRPLGYRVPQLAKPWFEKTVKEYREAERVAEPRVLDIGCSYGVNAALLKHDLTMDELYDRYDGSGPGSRAALLERDRDLTRSRRPAHPLRFTGLDASAEALAYAHEAGFLDDTVNADLEADDPTPAQRDRLAGTDLVISTGCIGYVTERTLTRVVRAQDGRLPWMAHFVLRMFPFGPVEDALDGLGYRTVRIDEVFRQRRFAGPEERRGVLAGLAAADVDASGLEEDGWLYAQLYLSRPRHR
ncbi:class I SAM-dependent methyltransferase [Streptomyces sp. NPDC002793]|uniref:class I SAM-dependent methyltransferase n=1 Tax=Streptomyces sp. NPDC002793 TaxID=3154432 RepID=UPI00331DCFF8